MVDVCYELTEWPKPYQTLMLLELVKGLKNLGVLKKQLERTCKGLNIKINYNKHKQKD